MADRHQFRVDWHDYNDGIYFVTVCCAGKKHLLGRIDNSIMHLSRCGQELETWIAKLSNNDKYEIFNHVVMPNHFHILVGTRFCASTPNGASNVGADAQKRVPTSDTKPNVGCLKQPRHSEPAQNNHHNSALAVFIGNLKGGITRFARKYNINFGWQERFHEHIVRDRHSFDNIMNYIDNNVANWSLDCFNTAPAQRLANADTMRITITQA